MQNASELAYPTISPLPQDLKYQKDLLTRVSLLHHVVRLNLQLPRPRLPDLHLVGLADTLILLELIAIHDPPLTMMQRRVQMHHELGSK